MTTAITIDLLPGGKLAAQQDQGLRVESLRRDADGWWLSLRRLADDGVTLLVSSHVMDEAEQCDNLILMREGGLVAELTPDELRARTGHNNLEKAFLALIEAGGQ